MRRLLVAALAGVLAAVLMVTLILAMYPVDALFAPGKARGLIVIVAYLAAVNSFFWSSPRDL